MVRGELPLPSMTVVLRIQQVPSGCHYRLPGQGRGAESGILSTNVDFAASDAAMTDEEYLSERLRAVITDDCRNDSVAYNLRGGPEELNFAEFIRIRLCQSFKRRLRTGRASV